MAESWPSTGAWVKRTSGARSLQLSLIELAVVTVVLAAVEVSLYLHRSPAPVWVLLLLPAVGVEFVAAGLLAWCWRPSNRTGALLCLVGVSLLTAALLNTDVPGLVAMGLVFSAAPIAVMLHALLAFPRGRLDGLVPRALAGAGYFISIALQAPRYLFATASGPAAIVQVADRLDLVQLATVVQASSGAVVTVMTALVLGARLRAATPAQRRVLAVLYPYGIAAIFFLEAAGHVLPQLFGFDPITVFVLQISALAGVPVALVSGVLRGGFARTGEIEELRGWLESQGGRSQTRDALALALGDESLELLFWFPEREQYMDASGAAVALPSPGSGRAAVEIALPGRRVAAIVYDTLLVGEPELVRTAGRLVSLALERERLTAELLASRDALQASRARIASAADRERDRIARDLHDGLQARLVLLAIKAGRLATQPAAAAIQEQIGELRAGLEAASNEVRHLVQGVMPALLIERGLYAATEELVDRMPLPTRLWLDPCEGGVPERVQRVGYFVIAEALTNAVKHAHAHELVVRLARTDGSLTIEVRDDGVGGADPGSGTGLRGIADRIDVLGGRLQVDSARGSGTRVQAVLPCGS